MKMRRVEILAKIANETTDSKLHEIIKNGFANGGGVREISKLEKVVIHYCDNKEYIAKQMNTKEKDVHQQQTEEIGQF